MHQGRLSPLDGGSKSHYTSTTHFIDPAQTSLSLPPPTLKPSPLCFPSYAPLLSSYSCPNLSLLFPPLLAGVRGHSRTGCDLWLKLVGGKQCDGKIFLSPGREATTFAAKGSGGALKLPQRVRAEPGRQTYFTAFGAIKLNLVMMIFNNLLLKNLK